MALPPEMLARIAERRENEWAFAGPSVQDMTDEQVADLFGREEADAAALAANDRAVEDGKLAALGLARDQIVCATGYGSHHDSHGAEVIALADAEWRVSGIESGGAICLTPVQVGGHYALVRREQIKA